MGPGSDSWAFLLRAAWLGVAVIETPTAVMTLTAQRRAEARSARVRLGDPQVVPDGVDGTDDRWRIAYSC